MEQTTDMECDSRQGNEMHSQPAGMSSNAVVRAEDPVVWEGHRNVLGLACRSRQRPRKMSTVSATHAQRRSFMGRIQ